MKVSFQSQGFQFTMDLDELKSAGSVEELEKCVYCTQIAGGSNPQPEDLENISRETLE